MALTPDEDLELEMINQKLKIPASLNQGNMPAQNNQNPGMMQRLNENSFMQSLTQSPTLNAINAVGDTTTNAIKAVPAWMSSLLAPAAGLEKGAIPYNPIKTGEGTAYDIASYAPGMAAMLAGGKINPAMAIATSALGSSMMNPSNPVHEFSEGARFGLLGESLPFVGEATKWAANKFKRTDLVPKYAEKLREQYIHAKDEAWSHVEPIFKKYGDKKLSSKLVDKVDKSYLENMDYMTPDIEVVKDEFLKNPTLKNLQDFQSMIGIEMRALDTSDPAGRIMAQHQKKYRDQVLDTMRGVMDQYKPGYSENFNKFLKEYATGPAKYEGNKVLSKAVRGQTEGISPESLSKNLTEYGQQRTGLQGQHILPEEHYIRQAAQEIAGKMERTKAYKNVADIGTGALSALTGAAFGGPLGGLAGGLGGLTAAKFASPISGLATNKQIEKLLRAYYEPTKRAAYGARFRPETEEEYR